ncbi:uncharacterized [Tachysurus ichikawai]
MTTSQDYREEQSHHPRRIRRIPGHLEDFLLTSESVSNPFHDDVSFHDKVNVEYHSATPERRQTEHLTETERLRRVEKEYGMYKGKLGNCKEHWKCLLRSVKVHHACIGVYFIPVPQVSNINNQFLTQASRNSPS